MHDRAAATLDRGGLVHHIHHDEGRDAACARGERGHRNDGRLGGLHGSVQISSARSCRYAALEHFRAKWKPVRVKKMRQIKGLGHDPEKRKAVFHAARSLERNPAAGLAKL
jgi:hypothetical protein